MKKLAFLTIVLLSFSGITKAQDLHSSQFYEMSVMRNPALVGIFSGDYKALVNYRRQWGSISVPFQTYQSSIESRIKLNDHTDYLSVGLAALYDKAGSTSFNSFYIYPAINYNKSLEDAHHSYISVGITAGYAQRSLNIAKMTFGDQFDGGWYNPSIVTADTKNDQKYQYWDIAAGISFNSTANDEALSYYIAVGAYRLNNPDGESSGNSRVNALKIPLKMTGNIGMRWAIQDHLIVNIDANYIRQGQNNMLLAGGTVGFRSVNYEYRRQFGVYGGAYFRAGDAWIPTLKIDYNRVSFIASYDVNYSGLKAATASKGGMEITLHVNGLLDQGIFASDKVECPRYGNDLLQPYR